jgi:hypothetical protein
MAQDHEPTENGILWQSRRQPCSSRLMARITQFLRTEHDSIVVSVRVATGSSWDKITHQLKTGHRSVVVSVAAHG